MCPVFFRWIIEPTLLSRFVLLSFVAGIAGFLFIFKAKKNVQISRSLFGLLIAFYLTHITSTFLAINTAEAFFESQRIFLTISMILISAFIFSSKRSLLNFHFAFVFFAWVSLIICIVDVIINEGDESMFFGHVNILSSFLLGVAAILFVGFYHLKGNWRFISFRTGYLVIIFLAFVMTRSVVIAAVICFILGFLLVMLKTVKQKRIFLITYLTLGITGGLILILFPEILPSTPNSLNERFGLWENTLKIIQENPINGVGAGNWQFHYTKFGVAHLDKSAFFNINFRRPHNDFLGILSETGIIGFGLFLSMVIIVTRKFAKNISLPIDKLPIHLFCGLLGFMIVSYFSFPKERILHLMLFAFMFGALLTKTYPKNVKGINPKIVGVMITIGMIFNLVIGVQRIKGEYYTELSLKAQLEANGKQAIYYGNKALSQFYTTDPIGVPIHTYIGWGYNQSTRLNKLLYHSERAYQYAPNNYDVLNNYGYVLQRLQNFKQAEELYLKAYNINPNLEVAIINLTALEYNRGNYEKALHWLMKIENYKQKYPSNYDRIVDHLN